MEKEKWKNERCFCLLVLVIRSKTCLNCIVEEGDMFVYIFCCYCIVEYKKDGLFNLKILCISFQIYHVVI